MPRSSSSVTPADTAVAVSHNNCVAWKLIAITVSTVAFLVVLVLYTSGVLFG